MSPNTHARITPRPAVRLAEVQRVVREVHTGATNIRGKSVDPNKLPTHYEEWVEEAVRMLRGALSAEDIDRLVLTRRYWAIQTATGAVPPRVVNTEIDERITELAETLEWLEATTKKWEEVAGRLVVFDSTVYCQHPDKIRDIDFVDMLGCREAPVRLVVPILVLDELEGLKRHNKPHSRWRAGHTLGVLYEVTGPDGIGMLKDEDYEPLNSGGIPRGRVDVEVAFDPPGHRRLPINDDELIDRALALAAESGRRVTFVTYDTAQAMRASFAGLSVQKLTEELGAEPDR